MTQLPPDLAAALAANPDLARVNPDLVGPDILSRGKAMAKALASHPEWNKGRQHPEDDFQQQIIDYAHLHGWRVAHFRSVKVTRNDGSTYWQTPVQADGAGFPDLIMLRGKELLVVEVKVDGGKLSDAQKAWLQAFNVTGIEWHVWYPIDWPEIEQRLK